MESESERYLAELKEYVNKGQSCSRAAVAWLLTIAEPVLDSMRAWDRENPWDGDVDDGT